MSARQTAARLIQRDEIVAAPTRQACDDHTFELPPVIYGTMAAGFFGFLMITATAFAQSGLVMPMAINFIFLTAFFAIPIIFVRASPGRSRARRWSEFMRNGIQTATGPTSGREAVILTLMLPLFILCWGVAVTIIAVAV